MDTVLDQYHGGFVPYFFGFYGDPEPRVGRWVASEVVQNLTESASSYVVRGGRDVSSNIPANLGLVGGDWNHGILNDFTYSGNFIIPTDSHIFQSQPPTRIPRTYGIFVLTVITSHWNFGVPFFQTNPHVEQQMHIHVFSRFVVHPLD